MGNLIKLDGDALVFLEKKKCPDCGGVLIKTGLTYCSAPQNVVFYRTGWECQGCGSIYVEGVPIDAKWERVLSTGLWTLTFPKGGKP